VVDGNRVVVARHIAGDLTGNGVVAHVLARLAAEGAGEGIVKGETAATDGPVEGGVGIAIDLVQVGNIDGDGPGRNGEDTVAQGHIVVAAGQVADGRTGNGVVAHILARLALQA